MMYITKLQIHRNTMKNVPGRRAQPVDGAFAAVLSRQVNNSTCRSSVPLIAERPKAFKVQRPTVGGRRSRKRREQRTAMNSQGSRLLHSLSTRVASKGVGVCYCPGRKSQEVGGQRRTAPVNHDGPRRFRLRSLAFFFLRCRVSGHCLVTLPCSPPLH